LAAKCEYTTTFYQQSGENKMDQTISINIITPNEFQGDVLLSFQPAAEQAGLTTPGKDVGDIRLTDTGADKRFARAAVSLGPREKIDAESVRRAGASIVQWLIKNKVSQAGIDLYSLTGTDLLPGTSALCEGLLLGAFRFDRYKSLSDEQVKPHLSLLALENIQALNQVLEHATIVAGAVNMAREWAHEPPNVINPVTLAEKIQTLAAGTGLKCTVLDDDQLEKIGAGAILAVGKGSRTPSRLIVLEYPGEASTAPVSLVGKCITFDTGGYSLKNQDNMLGMKYDKSGGMDVAAVLLSASRLGIRTPLVGVIAAAENMVSDKSYRPNDIIKTLSGKTVEIISADAEGRMVLCDALTYTQQTYHPRLMVDLATLTGGVVVALGYLRAGVLSNNKALSDALIAAGERTHELLWPLPLDDEYFELIKGDDSDMKNCGPRLASSTQGGIFLKQFVAPDLPWAHLDIAGTADSEKDLPYSPKGATGFGVRLLIDYLEHLEA
jgi:leucyl aminopeptidase